MREPVPFPLWSFITLGLMIVGAGWVALKLLKFLLTLV